MAEGSETEGGRWGTVLGLVLASLFLAVLDSFSLLLVPLALLVLVFPPGRGRVFWKIGAATLLLGMLLPVGGGVGLISRSWALMVAVAFAAGVAFRPGWTFFPRALGSVVAGALTAAIVLIASGGAVDRMLREHFRRIAEVTAGSFRTEFADVPWAAQLEAVGRSVAELQWWLFPALLALQTLAALALAWWGWVRLRGGRTGAALRPLREFRFNDHLVWVLVAGLALLALPLDGVVDRIGANALVLMGALYALRGMAVLAYLVGRAPSFLSVMFAVLVTLFLYPLVVPTVLVVGLGDTWLDVRKRAASVQRA